MVKQQIEKILHEKRITKTTFAEIMGIKKQNVNLLLETRKIDKIQEIANKLEVDINDLLFEKKKEKIIPTIFINGFVEVDSEIYPIKSREQIINLIDRIDGNINIPYYTEDIFMRSIESFYYNAIKNNQSGATMMRYGINQIISLSYDSETKRFYLTLSRDNGITEHRIFDIGKYERKKIENPRILIEEIIFHIENPYK